MCKEPRQLAATPTHGEVGRASVSTGEQVARTYWFHSPTSLLKCQEQYHSQELQSTLMLTFFQSPGHQKVTAHTQVQASWVTYINVCLCREWPPSCHHHMPNGWDAVLQQPNWASAHLVARAEGGDDQVSDRRRAINGMQRKGDVVEIGAAKPQVFHAGPCLDLAPHLLPVPPWHPTCTQQLTAFSLEFSFIEYSPFIDPKP